MTTTNALSLDLQPLSDADRIAAITVAYTALPPGAALLLIGDRDPAPLLAGLRQAFGSAFTWTGTGGHAASWTARIARVSHIDALAEACPNCTCRGAALPVTP